MRAIVIGAGIGGLSAAVALKKAGIDCTVFEAVKEIRPVGAAISIWPNGVKCMQHLGMGDIMETFGGPLRRMAYRDFRSGENMTSTILFIHAAVVSASSSGGEHSGGRIISS